MTTPSFRTPKGSDIVAALALLSGALLMTWRIVEGVRADKEVNAWTTTLREDTDHFRRDPSFSGRILVVGAALPNLADVYGLGWRLTAQIRPTAAAARLPRAEMIRLVKSLPRQMGDLAWITFSDGTNALVPLGDGGQ